MPNPKQPLLPPTTHQLLFINPELRTKISFKKPGQPVRSPLQTVHNLLGINVQITQQNPRTLFRPVHELVPRDKTTGATVGPLDKRHSLFSFTDDADKRASVLFVKLQLFLEIVGKL